MTNFSEHLWALVTFNESVRKLMQTYVQHPPRRLQSEGYSGPITLSNYQRFQWLRQQLQEHGFSPPLPSGN